MTDERRDTKRTLAIWAAIGLALAGFIYLDHRITELESRTAVDDLERCALHGDC